MYQFARVDTGRQEGSGNGIQGEGFRVKGFRLRDIYLSLQRKQESSLDKGGGWGCGYTISGIGFCLGLRV